MMAPSSSSEEDDTMKMLLELGGGEIRPYQGLKTLKEIFEHTARCIAPDKVALEDATGRRALSYSELDSLADSLAVLLRERFNVGPESLVGLAAERTIGAMVSMLAILKAGGAYVPLGLRLPDGRLKTMMDDISPSVVLCGQACAERFSNCLGGAYPLYVVGDEDNDNLVLRDVPPIQAINKEIIAPGGDDLAYVIFTSGTTGKPKGVMVSNLAVANYIDAMRAIINPGPNERVIQIMELTFDSSIFDIWMAWAFGGTVVLCDQWTALEGFSDFIRTRRITCLGCTPTQLGAISPRDVPDLRVVAIGGEAVPPPLIREWARHPSCHIYNQYGPTEATVTVTSIRCTPDMKYPKSIGTANPGSAKLYILDSDGEPVKPNVPGELCIAGPQVARGYLYMPDLTAEKFVKNRFSNSAHTPIFYKTGDRCRWLPDGSIEYLGRLDSQVKIRGYRIELGEVESKVLERKDVRACAVAVRHRKGGAPFLCAYLVPERTGAEVDTCSLRCYLASSLPDHMIPAAFVTLGSIPLDSSGKADRSSLPDPQPHHFVVSKLATQAPRNHQPTPQSPLYMELLQIFAHVLGLEPQDIGQDANFFRLGGQSLSAARFLGEVRQRFGTRVRFAEFFAEPTLKNVFSRIETNEVSYDIKIGLDPHYRKFEKQLPLSSAQARMYFLYQLDPNSSVYHASAVFDLKNGVLDHGRLENAFRTVIGRHEILHSSYGHSLDGPFQIVQNDFAFSLAQLDVCDVEEDDRRQRIQKAMSDSAAEPFDLEDPNAVPIRALHIRLGKEHSQLAITAHHIAVDGLSWEILYAELSAAYADEHLPPPSIQFSDFCLWETKFRRSAAYRDHLAYWREELGENPEPLRLPTDRPRPVLPSGQGGTVMKRFQGLASPLRMAAAAHATTPFCILLSAYFVLLHRLTGQTEIIVGILSSGRSHPDTEALIGMFVNTLPIKVKLGTDVSFLELVAKVKQATAMAFDHQDIALEDLVRGLVHSRSQGQSPLVQTMLTVDVFDEKGASGPVFDGLEVTELQVGETKTAMFELSIGFSLGSGDHLIVEAEFAVDLFDQSTVSRIVDQLESILRSAILTESAIFGKQDKLELIRNEFPHGDLPPAFRSSFEGMLEPRTTEEIRLAAIFCDVLDLPRVDIRDSFFALGGDSILSFQLVALARSLGYYLNVTHVMEFQTVEKLASFLLSASSFGPNVEPPEQKTKHRQVDLTPIQRWFFNERLPVPSHYNQSSLFLLRSDVDGAVLKSALLSLIVHHDALRLSYQIDDCHSNQIQHPDELASKFLTFHIEDTSKENRVGLLSKIERETERDQSSLDIEKGPLVAATLFKRPSSNPQLLSIIIHHLVIDEISWRVIIDDLNLSYFRVAAGQPAGLPPKSHSFAQWATALRKYSASPSLASEHAHWAHAESSPFKLPLEAVLDGYTRIEPTEDEISTSIDCVDIEPLLSNTTVRDVVVAALAWTLVELSGDCRDVCILIEGHGRESGIVAPGFDLSRTVGWFTSVFPVRFEFGGVANAGTAFRTALEQLNKVPNNGIGYGLLKYPYCGSTTLSDFHASQITFNYLGWSPNRATALNTKDPGVDFLDSSNIILSSVENIPCGSDWDQRNHSDDSILEISCRLFGARLEMNWRFRSDLLSCCYVQKLAKCFSTNLPAMINEVSNGGPQLQSILVPIFGKQIENAIDAIWAKHRHHDNFNGMAASAVIDGKIAFAGGHGFRDANRNIPVDPRTVFSLGSAGKPFVSLLGAILADEGIVDLDAPLEPTLSKSKISLPEIPFGRMTLRQLFSMTAGIPYVESDVEENIDDPFEICRSAIQTLDEPGSRYFYSNFSYALAGYFLAVSAGFEEGSICFEDLPGKFLALLEEKVFAPVGMHDARPEGFQFLSKNGAVLGSDHVRGAEGSAAMLPSGPVKASVTDTARFLITEFQRGLSPAGFRVASASRVSERFDVSHRQGSDWGMGWFRDRHHGFLYISGQWADAMSGLKLDPVTGFGFSYSLSVRDSTQLQFIELDMDKLFIDLLGEVRRQIPN